MKIEANLYVIVFSVISLNFNEEIFQLEIKSKKFSSEKQYLLFIDCLTMGT
jgi:hypothetical protein